MIGGSYVGLTQWQAAVEQPPHLVAIAPHYSSSDYLDGWTYQGGAFDLWFAQSWTSQTLAPDTLQRRLEAAGASADEVRGGGHGIRRRGTREAARRLALAGAARRTSPAFRRDGNIAAVLRRVAGAARLRRLLGRARPRDEVPAHHGSGARHRRLVRRLSAEGTIRNFMGVRATGGSEAARTGTQLVMRALCHACPSDTTAGEIDFRSGQRIQPERGMGALVRLLAEGDRQRRRRRPGGAAVRDGAAGRGDHGRWILDRPRTRSRCRTRSRPATTCGATAAPTRPGATAHCPRTGRAGRADEYTYDPADPVPTVGGNMCCRERPGGLGRVRSARGGAA